MGTSGGSPLRRKIVQDHPHAYGDKRFQLSPAVTVKGSSPRVWGQDISTDTPLADGRIIPTRVGTRLANKNNPTETEDHPHACGDKGNSSKILSHEAGSSPRVWGQVQPSRCFNSFIGSSPRVWGQAFRLNIRTLPNRIIPTRVGTRSPSGKVRRWA